MSRLKALYVEWQARRAGRRGVASSIHRAARDVTGPTGWVFSATWDELDRHGDAYIKSFDPRIPPSIFISERDRLRHHQPMPLVERCIEDHPRQGRRPTVARLPESIDDRAVLDELDRIVAKVQPVEEEHRDLHG